MSEEQKNALKILIVATNRYYNKQLSDDVVLMQVEDLVDLKFESVAMALKSYRLNSKNKFAPLPAQIRELIEDAKDPNILAIDTVSKIIGCISNHGPYNSNTVKQIVGPVGWAIIEIEGGWTSICESVNYENIGIFRAQWKQLAEIFHSRESRRQLDNQQKSLSTQISMRLK